MAQPSIACISFVAKNDHPLYVTIFPPFRESRLRFLILINSCLDIFDLRARNTFIDQDLGLLQALDERLAVYGWLTNTGVKILIIVDLAGRHADGAGQKQSITPVTGIKHSDLKPLEHCKPHISDYSKTRSTTRMIKMAPPQLKQRMTRCWV
ncbi:conserved hypothetical protein [Talaromyces marneffei ATCC 18224]|uniref:Uncharacterized protein n=1 Tax=Talaromyces marneffei (strain ATCC 18224 / CBS 334.59 / QM 7333) TaxID=441960 RepID=B6Q2R0_TALMQ|nr:conserved hypothetical protein [Talaromyces marneffei ATCC 18224]